MSPLNRAAGAGVAIALVLLGYWDLPPVVQIPLLFVAFGGGYLLGLLDAGHFGRVKVRA